STYANTYYDKNNTSYYINPSNQSNVDDFHVTPDGTGPPNDPMIMASNPANEGDALGIVVEADGDGLNSGDILMDLRADGDGSAANVTSTKFIVGGGGEVAINKNYDDGDNIPYTLEVNGTIGARGQIDANSNKIVDVATPTNGSDAATKSYVDSTAGGGVQSGSTSG
ncbi:MAG: hypothetical protein ABEI53_02295, partial [Candidatus Magasanikbacteria bacterium]